MNIEIRNLPEVQRLLQNLSERELKYATVVGTNRVAYAVMQAQREEVKTAFQGPTRFIQTGIRYEKMTFSKPTSRAYWTNDRDKIISPHVYGGAREEKKIEKALRARSIMSTGLWIVPGPAALLDKFGNPTRSTWEKLYAAINTLATVGGIYEGWFVGGKYPRRNLLPGIWERKDGKIEPVFLFVRKPQYSPRYPFYETAINTVNQEAPGLMQESVRRAIERSKQ